MVSRDIRVDKITYDTVLSTAFIAYDEEKKEIEEIFLMSNFCYTDKSSLRWVDMGQYGACYHTCAIREYSALAELLKNKDWTWNTAHNALDIDRKAGNVPQELKDEVLRLLFG